MATVWPQQARQRRPCGQYIWQAARSLVLSPYVRLCFDMRMRCVCDTCLYVFYSSFRSAMVHEENKATGKMQKCGSSKWQNADVDADKEYRILLIHTMCAISAHPHACNFQLPITLHYRVYRSNIKQFLCRYAIHSCALKVISTSFLYIFLFS